MSTRDRARPRILCGDFNAPVEENERSLSSKSMAAGQIPGQGRTSSAGAMPSGASSKTRTCATSIAPLTRPDAAGRRRTTRAGTPRRYDHIFASPEFETVGCKYLTGWLDRGMSDHAAVEAEFKIAKGSRK